MKLSTAVVIATGLCIGGIIASQAQTGFRLPNNTIWDGHQLSGGGIPVASGCGSPTISPGSTDTSGLFIAQGASGCVVTFAVPYVQAPRCITQNLTTPANNIPTVTTTTIAFGTTATNDNIAWFCLGRQAG